MLLIVPGRKWVAYLWGGSYCTSTHKRQVKGERCCLLVGAGVVLGRHPVRGTGYCGMMKHYLPSNLLSSPVHERPAESVTLYFMNLEHQ